MDIKRSDRYVIRTSLQGILVGITILYCILFPADKMNIKEILLIITVFIGFPNIYRTFSQKENMRLLFFSIVYPVVVTLISMTIGDSSIYGALSYGYVWLFLLLIPIIVDHNINIKKVFLVGTFIVATAINFIYFSDLLGFISIYQNPVVIFLNNMNELQWGKGELATFGYSIFHKTSPLIVISYGYMIKEKRYVFAAYLFMALLASGTRANLLVAIFITVSIQLLCEKKPTKRMIAIVLIIGVALVVAPKLIDRLSVLNALKYDRSEAIKINTAFSIFNTMNSKPYSYFFGTGVGSFFFNAARGKMEDVVEISFLDYFRQVGVFGFTFFLFFITSPIKWLYKNHRWLLFCYIGYLAIAFTNPLLVTSTSFVVYILIFSNAFGEQRENLLNKRNLKLYHLDYVYDQNIENG